MGIVAMRRTGRALHRMYFPLSLFLSFLRLFSFLSFVSFPFFPLSLSFVILLLSFVWGVTGRRRRKSRTRTNYVGLGQERGICKSPAAAMALRAACSGL